MTPRRVSECVGLLILLVLVWTNASAEPSETFMGALASLPASTVDIATMIGTGSATAVLDGERLEISGTFDNLGSPATSARIHRARAGMRGPSILELKVPRAASGKFEERLVLTPAQILDLKSGWLCIQIGTERHPDGQVRAWLLRIDSPR